MGRLAQPEIGRVEAHLRHCSDCRTVLSDVARSLETSEPAGVGVAIQIERYAIRALLGAGASGVVYRAFDTELRREVALKVLRPDLHASSSDFKKRMLREAQAMAQLSHPNVVAVHDLGVHEDTVYIVMEYVAGATLAQWLAAQTRTPHEVLKVFIEAGRGLAAAHDKGLIHRDFKPENVLVAADGRAKVTDFGLAHLSEAPVDAGAIGDATAEAATLTRGLIGTPAYLAPELFDSEPASAKSDQFAFCVSLHCALFARHPYRAGEGISLSELITRVKSEARDEPLPGTLAGQQHILHVLERGLRAEPRARYPDMPSLLLQLELAARASGQRRRVLATAGLVLAAAGSVYAWTLLQAPKSREPEDTSASSTAPDGQVTGALLSESNRVRSPGPPLAPTLPLAPTSPLAHTTGSPAVPSATGAASGETQSYKSTHKNEAQRGKRTPPPAPRPKDVRYRDGLKEPF
jgi:serine/threonine protein kinase